MSLRRGKNVANCFACMALDPTQLLLDYPRVDLQGIIGILEEVLFSIGFCDKRPLEFASFDMVAPNHILPVLAGAFISVLEWNPVSF